MNDRTPSRMGLWFGQFVRTFVVPGGGAIMSKNIKQPVPSEQNIYTATVRFSLEVSRGYLAAPGTAILLPN